MLRFLITDDDDVMRAFLRHVLLGVGDVNHAFSGQEAVEAGDGALAEPGFGQHPVGEKGEDSW